MPCRQCATVCIGESSYKHYKTSGVVCTVVRANVTADMPDIYTPTGRLPARKILLHACRQGPRSSEHVDILANVDVMTDVLKIAAGYGHKLKDNITSNIVDIAAQIHCFDD